MRFILDKHPGAKILGLKTPAPNSNIGPFNTLKDLFNKQLRRISHSSSALILDLI
jgi:hypothetical protein